MMVTVLMPKVLEVLFGQPAFEKGARVDAGRGVALEVYVIAGLVPVAGMEEMVVTDLFERGERGIGRDMTPDAGIVLVGTDHHAHGVPADQALYAALECAVAGIRLLLVDGDGVDVGREQVLFGGDAILRGVVRQTVQQVGRAWCSTVFEY